MTEVELLPTGTEQSIWNDINGNMDTEKDFQSKKVNPYKDDDLISVLMESMTRRRGYVVICGDTLAESVYRNLLCLSCRAIEKRKAVSRLLKLGHGSQSLNNTPELPTMIGKTTTISPYLSSFKLNIHPEGGKKDEELQIVYIKENNLKQGFEILEDFAGHSLENHELAFIAVTSSNSYQSQMSKFRKQGYTSYDGVSIVITNDLQSRSQLVPPQAKSGSNEENWWTIRTNGYPSEWVNTCKYLAMSLGHIFTAK